MAWNPARLLMGLTGLALLASGGVARAEWVATWAAAPHAPMGSEGPFAAATYDNVTLSQIVRISEGGDELRVRFSNRYGPGPLEIGAARIVRIDDAGAEIAGTARTLTFGGEEATVIPKGAPFVSDAVALDAPDLSRFKVEFYLPKPTGPCTCHLTGLDTLEVSPPGNFVGKAFTAASTAQFRAFLAGIEVDSSDAEGTIVTYGDSITDGVGSTPGANRRWPDVLAERLQEAGLDYGVANLGISGNRVLQDGMGESALARFDDDVLSLPNVEYLILFEGINDINLSYGMRGEGAPSFFADLPNRPIDADDIIAGYRQIVARAQAHGIKVYGATIAPYKGVATWNAQGEAARQAVNAFIRDGGLFDAVLDFDKAFADPADPAQMRPEYHMGDWLHGSDAGYAAVAASIDLTLFEDDD